MSTRRAGISVSGVVLLLAVAGCGGPRSAGPTADRGHDHESVARSPAIRTVDESDLPPDGRAALRYAVAARSWTAANAGDQHRRQLHLSTGALRRALARVPPTRREMAALRADRARQDAAVVGVVSLLRAPAQSRYRFVLDERTVAAGQVIRARAAYLVDVRRRPGGPWLVAAFTIAP